MFVVCGNFRFFFFGGGGGGGEGLKTPHYVVEVGFM